jgi:hypothetical protein
MPLELANLGEIGPFTTIASAVTEGGRIRYIKSNKNYLASYLTDMDEAWRTCVCFATIAFPLIKPAENGACRQSMAVESTIV